MKPKKPRMRKPVQTTIFDRIIPPVAVVRLDPHFARLMSNVLAGVAAGGASAVALVGTSDVTRGLKILAACLKDAANRSQGGTT